MATPGYCCYLDPAKRYVWTSGGLCAGRLAHCMQRQIPRRVSFMYRHMSSENLRYIYLRYIYFRVPSIRLQDSRGLSHQQVAVLSSELDNLAEKLKGEVMIFEFSQ